MVALVAAYPAIASIFAGTATTATYATAAAGVIAAGSAVAQGVASKNASEAQAIGLEQQADQAARVAEEQGIQRRERLLNTLAGQNLLTGASGTAGGSVEALRLTDINEFEREQRRAEALSLTEQSVYSSRASGARSMGRQRLTGSLLNAGTSLAGIG